MSSLLGNLKSIFSPEEGLRFFDTSILICQDSFTSFNFRPELRSINCAHWSSNAPRFLYFGGESNSIGILNLETFKEIKAIESEDNCCLIRSTGRFLVTANQDGQVSQPVEGGVNFQFR